MVADQDGYSLIILGESYIKINITYSSGKWSDQIYNFRCQKYVKKGYMEMTKKIYLETLKSALGCSIYHYYDYANDQIEFITVKILLFVLLATLLKCE